MLFRIPEPITFAMSKIKIGKIKIMEHSETITPNRIEIECKTNRENLSAAWKKVHGGEIKFPKRHVEIPRELLIPFLAELQNPSRADDINSGATLLLRAVSTSVGNGIDATRGQSRAITGITKDVTPKQKPDNGLMPPKSAPVNSSLYNQKSESKPNRFAANIKSVADWNGYTWMTIIATMAVIYGLILYLDAIGILFGALYGLALAEAVRAARKPESQNEKDWAIFAVVVLETFSGVVHFAWLDLKLWQRAATLPFHFTDQQIMRDAAGKIVQRITTNATPGTIAVVLAIIISFLSIYAVRQQMNRTTDKVLAE